VTTREVTFTDLNAFSAGDYQSIQIDASYCVSHDLAQAKTLYTSAWNMILKLAKRQDSLDVRILVIDASYGLVKFLIS